LVTPLAIIGVASSTTKGLPTFSGAMRHNAVSTCWVMLLLADHALVTEHFSKISGRPGGRAIQSCLGPQVRSTGH